MLCLISLWWAVAVCLTSRARTRSKRPVSLLQACDPGQYYLDLQRVLPFQDANLGNLRKLAEQGYGNSSPWEPPGSSKGFSHSRSCLFYQCLWADKIPANNLPALCPLPHGWEKQAHGNGTRGHQVCLETRQSCKGDRPAPHPLTLLLPPWVTGPLSTPGSGISAVCRALLFRL